MKGGREGRWVGVGGQAGLHAGGHQHITTTHRREYDREGKREGGREGGWRVGMRILCRQNF